MMYAQNLEQMWDRSYDFITKEKLFYVDLWDGIFLHKFSTSSTNFSCVSDLPQNFLREFLQQLIRRRGSALWRNFHNFIIKALLLLLIRLLIFFIIFIYLLAGTLCVCAAKCVPFFPPSHQLSFEPNYTRIGHYLWTNVSRTRWQKSLFRSRLLVLQI